MQLRLVDWDFTKRGMTQTEIYGVCGCLHYNLEMDFTELYEESNYQNKALYLEDCCDIFNDKLESFLKSKGYNLENGGNWIEYVFLTEESDNIVYMKIQLNYEEEQVFVSLG